MVQPLQNLRIPEHPRTWKAKLQEVLWESSWRRHTLRGRYGGLSSGWEENASFLSVSLFLRGSGCFPACRSWVTILEITQVWQTYCQISHFTTWKPRWKTEVKPRKGENKLSQQEVHSGLYGPTTHDFTFFHLPLWLNDFTSSTHIQQMNVRLNDWGGMCGHPLALQHLLYQQIYNADTLHPQ